MNESGPEPGRFGPALIERTQGKRGGRSNGIPNGAGTMWGRRAGASGFQPPLNRFPGRIGGTGFLAPFSPGVLGPGEHTEFSGR